MLKNMLFLLDSPPLDADQGGAAVVLRDIDISSNRSFDARGPETSTTLWWGDYPVGAIKARDPLTAAEDLVEQAKLTIAREKDRTPGRCVNASIVICTRDRPNQLSQCLESLRTQTVQARQIIVVDNASTDGRTRDVALAAGVNYVREDRPGLDFARNAGALRVNADIVAYTDDDVRLHPRWLERLVAAFDSPDIMAVTGLVLPGELDTPAQRYFEQWFGFGRGFRRIDFGAEFFKTDQTSGCAAWEIGAGASMAFRREAFKRAGLFDERLDVGQAGCSGDSEFWHRILSKSGVCRYEPSAVAYHFHRKDWAGLRSQLYHYMRGHSAALLVQYERTGNLGNLRRAFWSTPVWYLKRCARRMLKGPDERNRFLGHEVAGYLSGLVFYFRAPRPKPTKSEVFK